MTLELREVAQTDLRTYFRLKVALDQQNLVAPNEITLAQAAYETGSYVWGLWADGVAVGLMAMIHPQEADELEDGDDPNAAYVWRLMIGEEHQRMGYGRLALLAAIEKTKEWKLPRICLTAANAPNSAVVFYERLGFVKTGRIVQEEIELMRSI